MVRTLLLFFFLSFITTLTYADGTRQLRKTATEKSCIQLYDQSAGAGVFRRFATYEADSSQRLYVTVQHFEEEVILFGFQLDIYTDQTYVRIKDASGAIVFGPQLVPQSGTGYISDYTQAVTGPDEATYIPNAGGYTPFVFVPPANGDYYLEFNLGDPVIPVAEADKKRHWFNLFDLSVVNTVTHAQISGRVWSRAWDFNTQGINNIFTADLYIYTDDGVVTEVNFNGMKPFGFVVSGNQTGIKTDASAEENRRSVNGDSTYPQYKIFLTYPDPEVYKAGESGTLINVSAIKCYQTEYCLNVTVTSSGLIEVLIDLNGTPGYQADTEDILADSNVTHGGTYCFGWNGKDGLGNPVEANKPFQAVATYTKGLTHLPLYDVEGHPKGYIVKTLVPDKRLLKLFWDDSHISGGSANLSGCTPDTINGAGCHGWGENVSDPVTALPPVDPPFFGNIRTINTWWYATLQSDTVEVTLPAPFTVSIASDHPTISKDTALLCPEAVVTLMDATQDILVPADNGLRYDWFMNGHVFYTGHNPKLSHLADKTVVTLIVTDPATDCFAEDTYVITVKQINVPNLITPNGDNMNDTFEITNLFPETTLEIYNRWGDSVYKTKNYDNSWGASSVQDGMYFYHIHTNETCGNFKGWLEVLTKR